IHLKKTDFPLVSTISREFSGMQVAWAPLYAPKDQVTWPYGTRFTTLEMMEFEEIPPEGWFMTARGVIRVALPKLAQAFVTGSTVDDQCSEFESIIARFVKPLIPLHIVFDGAQYYLEYTMTEEAEWAAYNTSDIGTLYPEAIEGLDAPWHNTDIATTYPPASNDNDTTGLLRFDQQGVDCWTLDKRTIADTGRQWVIHHDMTETTPTIRIATITAADATSGAIEAVEITTFNLGAATSELTPFPASLPAIQAFKARMDSMAVDAWPFDTRDEGATD
ncbi:MAG: hypothetical protein ACRC9M_05675, partial [Aeromonas sp.]